MSDNGNIILICHIKVFTSWCEKIHFLQQSSHWTHTTERNWYFYPFNYLRKYSLLCKIIYLNSSSPRTFEIDRLQSNNWFIHRSLAMFSIYTTLYLICYLPLISTIPIAIYKNARFDPFDNHSIIYNFSLIESRQVCICQCFMTATCKTAAYNGYYQYCVIYFAYLQEGQLRVMTIDANSSVISLRNMMYPGNYWDAVFFWVSS